MSLFPKLSQMLEFTCFSIFAQLLRCRIGPFRIPPAGSSVIPRDLDLFLSDSISSVVIAQWLRLVASRPKIWRLSSSPQPERLLQRTIVSPHCYQKYLKLPYRRRMLRVWYQNIISSKIVCLASRGEFHKAKAISQTTIPQPVQTTQAH